MSPNRLRENRTALLATAAAVGLSLYLLLPRGAFKRSFHTYLSRPHPDAALSFDEFIKHQGVLSWRYLLQNIHPAGTAPGCVVASPSRSKPNYFYQWTRDSSLVLKEVARKYKEGDESLLSIMLDFVEATSEMQHKQTPCGSFETGGLGEGKLLYRKVFKVLMVWTVKFEVNREPFVGPWGRP
jgi:glucoamylase